MSPGIPELAVADTHALIWWLTEPRRLGRHGRAFFDRVDRDQAVVCVATVALVEVSEALQRGSVSLGIAFEDLVRELEAVPSRYSVVSLSPAIVARSHSLFEILERTDRLIAATALDLDLPLITRDRELRGVPGLDVIW